MKQVNYRRRRHGQAKPGRPVCRVCRKAIVNLASHRQCVVTQLKQAREAKETRDGISDRA